MDYTILLATAVSVSIDSFFCGLNLALKKNEYYKIILGICLSVLTLCIVGSLVGEKLGKILSNYAELVGGFLLIIISILNLKQDKNYTPNLINDKLSTLKDSVLLGAVVGIDGGIGCFTLSIIKITGIIVPLTITVTHLIFITLSTLLCQTQIAKKISKFKELPEVILFLLGTIKILSAI